MTESQRRCRLQARVTTQRVQFQRDGHVILPAPPGAVFSQAELDALDPQPMSQFSVGGAVVDEGRSMHSFLPHFDATGRATVTTVEDRIAGCLRTCWDIFRDHVGLPLLHRLDRPSLLVSSMLHRTIQTMHLDYDAIPPHGLEGSQFSLLVLLGEHGVRLETSPTAWKMLQLHQRDVEVDAGEVVSTYLADRDPYREEFSNICVQPGQFLVFVQHFPHAGSLPNGNFNHRAHGYFTTVDRAAPVDSVTVLFPSQ